MICGLSGASVAVRVRTSFGHDEAPEVADGPVEAIDRARRGAATMTILLVVYFDWRAKLRRRMLRGQIPDGSVGVFKKE